jgi:ribosomal-protein-alanine N-acetyltransferase
LNIQTPRLTLRRFVEADAEDIVRISSLDRVFDFLPISPRHRDAAPAREAIEQWRAVEARRPGFGVWRVGTPDGQLVGSAFLEPCPRRVGHFGGLCLPGFWGRGVGFEVCSAVIDHGIRQLDLVGVASFTHRENAASQTVLKVCGFVEHGSLSVYDVPVKSFYVTLPAWKRCSDLLIGQGLAARPRELLRRLRGDRDAGGSV